MPEPNTIPLINGIRHSWASIRVELLGRTLTGISAIDYGDEQEKVNNYGAGIYPVSRGRGRYSANGKITLHAYEVEGIQSVLPPGGRLQDIAPFDVKVSFLPEGEDGLITHVIRNCEFTSNKREIKEGDTVIETEFELIVSHIKWS